MVDGEGDALIMDFGIARSTSAGMTMTAGNAVIGTIDYMAPEQARGGTVDQRADIYAFGLILNDMLLGRRQGGANAHGRADGPHAAGAAACPIDRSHHSTSSRRARDECLQPDPALRYQRLGDLLAELDLLDQNGHPSAGSGDRSDGTLPNRGRQRRARFATRRWILARVRAAGAGRFWLGRARSIRSPRVPSRPQVARRFRSRSCPSGMRRAIQRSIRSDRA